jgi:glycosyltransferase involved in cell wall biosynthesis
MPLTIGVLIPVYNYARFLPAALESVRAQIRPPDQVVIIDDGSSDGSAEVAASWSASNDFPLDIIRQANGGAAAARNAGLGRLTTDLVALLDADDVLFPDHLLTLERPFLDREGVVLSFADATLRSVCSEPSRGSFLGNSSVNTVHWQDVGKTYLIARGRVIASLFDGNYIPCCSSMFPRSQCLRIGGWDPRYIRCSDGHFFMRLSLLGDVAFSRRPLSEILRHDRNLSHSRHKLSQAEYRQRLLLESTTWTHLPPLLPDEKALALKKAAELSFGILHKASMLGPKELWRAARLQSRRGYAVAAANPKHWARAVLSPFLKG